eukprot:Opistho-1_new@9838
MGFQRDQDVVNRAGFVGNRDDQADTALARGLWCAQYLGQADHGKAGAVERIVLNRMGGGVQAELGTGTFAGDAGPGGVAGGQACAFGIAGDGTPFDMGQMRAEPALALRQRLGVGQDDLDAVEGCRQAQQVVTYQQAGFADHMHGGVPCTLR